MMWLVALLRLLWLSWWVQPLRRLLLLQLSSVAVAFDAAIAEFVAVVIVVVLAFLCG